MALLGHRTVLAWYGKTTGAGVQLRAAPCGAHIASSASTVSQFLVIVGVSVAVTIR